MILFAEGLMICSMTLLIKGFDELFNDSFDKGFDE